MITRHQLDNAVAAASEHIAPCGHNELENLYAAVEAAFNSCDVAVEQSVFSPDMAQECADVHGGLILPCPCCGGRAEEQVADAPGYEGGSFIECTRCGLSTPVEFDRKENLAAKWNSRVRS